MIWFLSRKYSVLALKIAFHYLSSGLFLTRILRTDIYADRPRTCERSLLEDLWQAMLSAVEWKEFKYTTSTIWYMFPERPSRPT